MRLKAQAEQEQANGRLDVALKKFIGAEQLFAQCKGAETEQSLCLYYMCISYFNQRDLSYMKKPMERLAQLAQPGDLILTIGAGDIYLAGEALLKREA